MYIKIQDLIKKYNIKINGILHLGAHKAEEATDYQKISASKVIWIEGNPELIPILETELKKYANQFAYNLLVSDEDNKKVNFNVTNNFQSSSILELGSHKDHHPEINVHHMLQLKTSRLDTFFTDNNMDISDCNFLNIDLQGAEMMALKGLGGYLKHFDYIYTEINIGKVYKNCALLSELDAFLHRHGFVRTETYLTPWEWGDAFYIRKNSSYLRKKNILFALYLQYLYSLKNKINKLSKRMSRKVKGLFFKKHNKSV